MKLESMVRSKGRPGKWTATLADVRGDAHYELAIRGPGALVERMFAKCDVTHEIDPGASRESADARLREIAAKAIQEAKTPYGDPGEYPFKKDPRKLDPARTVVVSAHRTSGHGTFWAMFFPFLALPAGASIVFALPPVNTCQGILAPIAGDSDLFLTLNSPLPPVVAKSTFAGTAVDSVSFGAFGSFMPFFRVLGFTNTVTNFWMSGFGFGF